FSSDYDSDQVSAHEDAISLFDRYAKGGDNAALKDWADKTLPALRHHLDMAKELGRAPSVGQSKYAGFGDFCLAGVLPALATMLPSVGWVQDHGGLHGRS
ncbi:DUF4142 domain-containing protein, partial [Acinetobacter baumannii]|uniref:DUF4142 domain-containing protein n=1 Tax=Acinetobacter baumannii TaxID=470 RepID=UPI001111A0B2